MTRVSFQISLLIVSFFFVATISAQKTYTATSISGALRLSFIVADDGTIGYSVNYKGKDIIKPSMGLGFKFKQPEMLLNKFDIMVVDSTFHDDTWQPVWGESKNIRNRYKELFVKMMGRKGHEVSMNMIFRVFDEGIGFRYEFPVQPNLNHFVVADELTSFVMV